MGTFLQIRQTKRTKYANIKMKDVRIFFSIKHSTSVLCNLQIYDNATLQITQLSLQSVRQKFINELNADKETSYISL
jgi:hypothetical protein